jgi:hypothetical protein
MKRFLKLAQTQTGDISVSKYLKDKSLNELPTIKLMKIVI